MLTHARRCLAWWLCTSESYPSLTLTLTLTLTRARWWLCTSESYPNCLPSKDFSDYYKRPVYVCQVE